MNFAHKCYKTLKDKVSKGKVTTYKTIAESLGTKAYRVVRIVMNKNPYVSRERSILEYTEKDYFSSTPKIPCHRVIKSDR